MRRDVVLVGVLIAAAASFVPATTPASADVHIGIQIGAPPQLVVVPGMPVYYAPAVPYNYFFYGGQYYVFHGGGWYFAPGYDGPWVVIPVEYVPRPILAVPVPYYKHRPGHWKKKHGPPPWAPAWGHRKKWKDRDEDD